MELQIQTIQFTPATVEFNYDQIAGVLNENLRRYQNLEFTEESAGECKKVIAELRKGKTLLDTYRKDTKKKLTESVIAFEEQCKALAEKFDEVINPLSEQHDQFEHDRKERKRAEIQGLIDSLIVLEGLDAKRAAQMIIPDEYLNKGKSTKDIKTELTALAKSLGTAQDKEAADVEIIKTKVELANAKHGLTVGLVDTTYIRLLEHDSITSIVEQINADAEVMQQREEAAKQARAVAPASAPIVTTADPKAEQFVERFEITGTEAQLSALESFLETNSFTWKILE